MLPALAANVALYFWKITKVRTEGTKHSYWQKMKQAVFWLLEIDYLDLPYALSKNFRFMYHDHKKARTNYQKSQIGENT